MIHVKWSYLCLHVTFSFLVLLFVIFIPNQKKILVHCYFKPLFTMSDMKEWVLLSTKPVTLLSPDPIRYLVTLVAKTNIGMLLVTHVCSYPTWKVAQPVEPDSTISLVSDPVYVLFFLFSSDVFSLFVQLLHALLGIHNSIFNSFN